MLLHALFSKRKFQLAQPPAERKLHPMGLLITNWRTEQKSVMYEVNGQLANALIASGLATKYVKAAAQPFERKWSVGHPPNNPGKWVLICADTFGGTTYFTGDADKYLLQPPVHCSSVCPKEVLALYKTATTPVDPDTVLVAQERLRNEDAQRQQREAELTAQFNRG